MNFHQLIGPAEYDFLRDHPRLGKRVILLGLGGSYAYGTDNENSDILTSLNCWGLMRSNI